MTKKDYEKAAKIVAKKRQTARTFSAGSQKFRQAYQASNDVEDAFVEFFRNDNPRFDEERFIFACQREVK